MLVRWAGEHETSPRRPYYKSIQVLFSVKAVYITIALSGNQSKPHCTYRASVFFSFQLLLSPIAAAWLGNAGKPAENSTIQPELSIIRDHIVSKVWTSKFAILSLIDEVSYYNCDILHCQFDAGSQRAYYIRSRQERAEKHMLETLIHWSQAINQSTIFQILLRTRHTHVSLSLTGSAHASSPTFKAFASASTNTTIILNSFISSYSDINSCCFVPICLEALHRLGGGLH